MISNRQLFVGGVLLGLVTALPAWAFAKGQWCNDKNVVYRATLTLESATVAGKAVALPTDVVFDVTSSASSSNLVTADLFCAACDGHVSSAYDYERQP